MKNLGDKIRGIFAKAGDEAAKVVDDSSTETPAAKADDEKMPNLFDIVMNQMQITQHELGNFKAISADVLISPDLSDFTWIEYYRADELIARGAEAARRALPGIEKAIEAKLAPIRLAAPGARPAAGS